jgi:hypothetical protein
MLKNKKERLTMVSYERKLEILEENGRINYETYTYLKYFDTNTCGVNGMKELIKTCNENGIEVYASGYIAVKQDYNELTKLYNVDERNVICLGTYYGESLLDDDGDESIIEDDRIYLIVK